MYQNTPSNEIGKSCRCLSVVVNACAENDANSIPLAPAATSLAWGRRGGRCKRGTEDATMCSKQILITLEVDA
jgi:hypothetical protein